MNATGHEAFFVFLAPKLLPDREYHRLNPSIYCLDLARHIIFGLGAAGINVTFDCAEDYGRYISVETDAPFRVGIHCSYYSIGDDDAFLVSVSPNSITIRPFEKLFRQVETGPYVLPVINAIKEMLEEDPDITDLRITCGGPA